MQDVCFIWILVAAIFCCFVNKFIVIANENDANTTANHWLQHNSNWAQTMTNSRSDSGRTPADSFGTNAYFFSNVFFLLCLFIPLAGCFFLSVLQSPHIQLHRMKWNRIRRVHRATDKLYAKKQHITLAHSSNSMLWLESCGWQRCLSVERFIQKSEKKTQPRCVGWFLQALQIFINFSHFSIELKIFARTQFFVHNFDSMAATRELLEFAF